VKTLCLLLFTVPAPSFLVITVEPHHVQGTWDWTLSTDTITPLKYYYRVYFSNDGTCRIVSNSRHGSVERGTWRLDSRTGELCVSGFYPAEGKELHLSFFRTQNWYFDRRFASSSWYESWEGTTIYNTLEARKR
jgi:hypothetical protein